MKNFKKLACIALSVFAMSCSKKEDTIAPILPSAAFEASNTTVTEIPDASNASPNISNSVEIAVTIDKEGVIADGNKITIELDLVHSWAGDIAIEVITPSGESCGLIKRIGSVGTTGVGTSDDFKATNKLVFNNTYVNSIPITGNTNFEIPTGNYKPTFGANLTPTNVIEKPMATFFNGKSVKGIWKLKAYDCKNINTGSVNAWKIKFDAGALQ